MIKNANRDFKIKSINYGLWLSIGSPIISELSSLFSFDWILLDLEHGFLDERDLLNNIQAISNNEVNIIVRIGKIDPLVISRVLDWGASGIMVPHISSVEEAKFCIKAMNYPPIGIRGYSSSCRSFKYGLEKSQLNSNLYNPLFFAQIETELGVKNADKIAALEGVDVLFVGPSDLKLQFKSFYPSNYNEVYNSALNTVIYAAKKQNKRAGILADNLKSFSHLKELGFSVFSVGNDLKILREEFKNLLNIYR